MKQHFTAFCTAAAVLCSAFPIFPGTLPAHADAAQGGSLTEQMTWSLTSYGTLTISGEGAMPDWTASDIDPESSEVVWEGEAPPWYAFRDTIEWITFSDNITHIGDYAFACCPNVTCVTFPTYGASIGEDAFAGNVSLVDVDGLIDSSITEIGFEAFWSCTSLTEIDLPRSLKTLHGTAFDDTALTKLRLPASLETIKGFPFVGCRSLTSIVASGDHFDSWNGALYDADFTTLIRYPNCEERFPEIYPSVTAIGAMAFAKLEHCEAILLPEGVTDIGAAAFCNSPMLETVYLPASLTNIRTLAFDSTALQTIYYGGSEQDWENVSIETHSVTSPNDAAFVYAASAADTRLPDGSGICGPNVVWTLDAAGQLTLSGTGRLYDFIYTSYRHDAALTELVVNWYSAPPPWYGMRENITGLTVCEGITSLTKGAFIDCGQLETVTLPTSLECIGVNAFFACKRLHQLALGHLDELQEIRSGAFAHTALETAALPETLQTVELDAFDDTSVRTLQIPADVTYISVGDFSAAPPFTEITVDPANTVYTADGKGLYLKDRSILLLHAAADTACIADGTEVLQREVLGRQSFTNVYLPAGIRELASNVFYDTHIETLYFGGTQAEWEALTANTNMDALTQTQVICDAVVSADLNQDGVVNASDASLTLLYGASAASGLTFSRAGFLYNKLGYVPLTLNKQGDAAHAADLTGDDNLNAMDSSVMLCYAAAAAAGLPEGESLETYLNR